MDLTEPMCRICRRQSDHLESLHGIREGLPISVLVMMICPIKITTRDNLPNFICEDCLEVLLAAHKLRDESLVSDRYFRECNETENLIEEEELETYEVVKREAVSSPVFEEATTGTYAVEWKKPKNRDDTLPQNSNDDEFNYEVDCYKKGANKSAAWDFFGRLVHSNGDLVESETGYFFCRLCVTAKKSIKNRYKSGNISTGMIFTHLKAAHGLIMGSRTSPPPQPKSVHDPQNPQITRQTFACPEENCGKEFIMKMCLDIHLGLEHTGIADEAPSHSDYIVDLSQKETRATSMAWNYFGFLLDPNHVIIDDGHYYCKLCVGVGNLAKYNKSCSTTTLFQHLRVQHLGNRAKRKRFCTTDVDEQE